MSWTLVTGASGYVGSHLVKESLKQGHPTLALVRPSSSLQRAGLREQSLLKIITLNNNSDVTMQLSNLLQKFSIKRVFHLAAQATYDEPISQVTHSIEANFSLGTQLLEVLKDSACRQFIYAGSFWQFNSTGQPLANGLYAALKNSFDSLLDYYSHRFSIFCTSLYLYDVYGPRDWRPKLLNKLQEHSKTGQVLELSPGQQKLSMIYIDDVVAAFFKAGTHMKKENSLRQKYFVGHPQLLSLQQLVQAYQEYSGYSLKVSWGAKNYRPTEVMTPYLGPSVPNWSPHYDFKEGLNLILNSKTPSDKHMQTRPSSQN